MKKGFRILAAGDASEAIEAMRRMTDRKDAAEVVADAFRTYEWVLEQQMKGRTIVAEPSNGGTAESPEELESFIKDRHVAEEYFGS